MRDLQKHLSDHRLRPMGQCHMDDSDNVSGTLVLIGPDEPEFWPHFQLSPEFRDGAPDSMDRWSRRVLDNVAKDMGATAVYPFGGAPFLPFYSWAVRTGRFWPSPIGFLVHDDCGLMASFRGALVFDDLFELPASGPSPCLSCPDQPCQTACPVGAFDGGYNVDLCKSHLDALAGAPCRQTGCLARRACPVGAGKRLPEQSAFHMRAFHAP